MDKKGPMEDAVLRLSGKMATPHVQGNLPIDEYSVETTVNEAEREVVLKANAMLTLADHIDETVYPQGGSRPVGRLTRNEWDLICYALRHTADSDN